MTRFFTATLLWLFIVLLPVTLLPQTNIDYNKLDETLQKALFDFNGTGLAVGIIKDGEVVFNKGYGYRDYTSKDTVTSKTLFGIASVSKAFTAASIGMLVDKGKLEWNDRVIDHLPSFQLSDPYVTRELRISDLLTHRAGYNTFDGDLLWYGTNYSRKEIIKRFKHMPAKKSLRIGYGYSNLMFMIAGEVIEAVSGKTWADFVEERIFNPVGMEYSNTTNNSFNNNMDIAKPHKNKKLMDFINYDNVGPAASINSCTDDLLKWLQMWLDKGKVSDNQLLSEETREDILTTHAALNIPPINEIGGRHFMNVGMGWFLSDYAGRQLIQHSGGLPGFLSRVALIPEDNIGIVVLTNDESRLYRAVTSEIIDIFLDKKNKDHFTEAIEKQKELEEEKAKQKAERRASRIHGTSPTLSLGNYAGEYEDKMYGKANVTFNNEELKMVLLPTEKLFNSKLTHWHYDTFNIKFNDPFLPEGLVTFELDNKGNVSGFKIELPNPDFHFYNYHFQKMD